MNTPTLTHKSPVELRRELARLREQLRDRRFKVAHGQYPDVRELRELKRAIARHLTSLKVHAK